MLVRSVVRLKHRVLVMVAKKGLLRQRVLVRSMMRLKHRVLVMVQKLKMRIIMVEMNMKVSIHH